MKLSIVTINYNNRAGLQKTIESVVNQSYKEIEYIVIDGGSVDGSVDVIKQYDAYISYWASEPDKGIYNAMNKGIVHATGDYCLFLNSGDCLHNANSISVLVSKLAGEDMLMGRVQCVPSGRIAYSDISYPLTMLDFFKGSPVPHPACLIRRALFEEQLYDENLKIVSDWKFFMTMIVSKNHSYKIVDDVVTDFLEEGLSSNKRLCELERSRTLKEFLPESIYADYKQIETGGVYEIEYYDAFFQDLKKYNRKGAEIIYKLAVRIVRIMSGFKKSLEFVEDYKNHAFDEHLN